MSFELKVGNTYELVRYTNGLKIQIIGKKSDHKHKCLFVADNGLSYSPDGHVIGYQEHLADLQPRVRALG